MKQDDPKPEEIDPFPTSKGVSDQAPLNDPDAANTLEPTGEMPGNSAMENEAVTGQPVDAVDTETIGTAMDHTDLIADTAAAGAAAMGMHIDPFIFRLTIFVLAIFVGYYVVWSVTPALHTPLMSVTNAISSVIIVGALIAVAVEVPGGWFEMSGGAASKWFGFFAVILASVNIFGGFLVTQRMLAMYKKKS